MEMGTKKPGERLEPKGELYKCPSCGYADGFHVSFKWNQKGSEAEVYLICPNCHARYRKGWKIKRAVRKKGLVGGIRFDRRPLFLKRHLPAGEARGFPIKN